MHRGGFNQQLHELLEYRGIIEPTRRLIPWDPSGTYHAKRLYFVSIVY
jgi:hypothetical protein